VDRKVNLTRAQLLKLLKEHQWEKLSVAEALGVDEASIRRACRRHNIDTDLERKSDVENFNPTVLKVHKPESKAQVQKGSFIVYPDIHDKDVNWKSFNAVCEFERDFKPEYKIQIGDLLDYEALMGKVKQKYPNFDAADLKSLDIGFQAASKIVSILNQASSSQTKNILLKGNHEYRADMLVKKHPEFENLLNFQKRIDLTGWNVLEYLVPFRLGKLNFIHGEFYGANHVKKHLIHYQKNVLYGHTHQVAQDTLASPMREIATWGASIGCLCDLNPDYQRNKSNAWEHGFAYGWFDEKTGDFQPMVNRIINNQFHAEGRHYRG
jgi:hypothetical protein